MNVLRYKAPVPLRFFSISVSVSLPEIVRGMGLKASLPAASIQDVRSDSAIKNVIATHPIQNIIE